MSGLFGQVFAEQSDTAELLVTKEDLVKFYTKHEPEKVRNINVNAENFLCTNDIRRTG